MISLKLATVFFTVMAFIAFMSGSSSVHVYSFLILSAIYNAATLAVEEIKK